MGSDQKSIVKKVAGFCIKITFSHLFFNFSIFQINFRLYAFSCKKVQKGQNFQNRLGLKIDGKESSRYLQKNHFQPFVFPFYDKSDQLQALRTFFAKRCKKVKIFKTGSNLGWPGGPQSPPFSEIQYWPPLGPSTILQIHQQ